MEKTKDPNILTYKELTDTLHAKMLELIKLNTMILNLQNKHNGALTALLTIKDTYPHIFEECVADETMNKMLGKEQT